MLVSFSELDALIAKSMSQVYHSEWGKGAMWKCDVCSRTNKDKSIIKHHVETHFHFQQTCPYCGQQMKTRKSLKMHISNLHSLSRTAKNDGSLN